MRSVRTRVKAGPMRGANFYQPRLGGTGPPRTRQPPARPPVGGGFALGNPPTARPC